MNLRQFGRLSLLLVALAAYAAPPAMAGQSAATQVRKVRVTGVVRDESNNITLPGVPVEVAGGETVYTDVDGRYVLDLVPGSYELKVTMDGYESKTIKVDAGAGERVIDANVGLTMTRFAETVTVTAAAIDAATSSAEAQLAERRSAAVITDNLGSQEMKKNADSDAAAAMSRVTGLSVVDNQYVFVRGLGERYSNTTLAGSTLPTTEPDKKVVPLDLFPAGLLDSVQVNKSYSPDRSAEFAGGLVQIQPLKFPNRAVLDFSYGFNHYATATGKSIPLSGLGNRDWLGFDDGARALPSGIPSSKIVRRGTYTPDVGFDPDQITAFGRLLDNQWRPVASDGAPGQNWGAVFGNRFGKLGIIASVTHSYKENFVQEQRAFYRIADDASDLEAVSNYRMQYGTQRAQLGAVGNIAYQFNGNHRLALENFYSHSGKDEGRFFEGPNTENVFYYYNNRLQFTEEGLISTALAGDHFLRAAGNSRIDWRVNFARANRDEPDLRETLYQQPFRTGTLEPTTAVAPVLADESQSGFRLFNNLDDETVDAAFNWSTFSSTGARPTQYKFGVSYVDRTRDFRSRRFRFIPIVLTKDGVPTVNQTQQPEQLYTSTNIGTAFRFNEETRPVDAYDGAQTTTSGYGMIDIALSARTRLNGGLRVERFDQEVNTFDPFGLFVRTITASNRNTDVFPAINLVQNFAGTQNLRLSYSTTVNRPEFRELAEFEFTDIVGSRAVRGNPHLTRALIQNVDARWELFPGARNVIAASAFFKNFDQPIERVVIAAANPITTFQNADRARNFGFELETAYELGQGFFVNANYTFVDSKITLLPEQRTVQTSLERALAGQSKNLFNLTAEYARRGFTARVLFNYAGDRVSDVGSNQAPDIVEQGRETVDIVLSQRLGSKFNIRLSGENLTDAEYVFTQGDRTQRSFKLGRTIGVSFGVNVF
ncbi:MAG TPA: TonB-dependent receptor [Vicinamibacterales bacterium]|nr:TonB-dependent receptor [Vicinamibacterales bacterium]